MPDQDVTVIVPVWNGEKTIAACLDGIMAQTWPKDRLQVIVVDNGSTDKTKAIVEAYPVLSLTETAPGSYAARNLALSRATGSFIAFTDADCVPDPRWIEEGVLALRKRPDAGVLAGHVDVAVRGAITPVADYERIFAFRQEDLARNGHCVTANWMSPKSILDAHGPFDMSLKSGGDWQLASKIAAAGHPVIYVSQMKVTHPARETLDEILVKRRRVAGGKWAKSGGSKGFFRIQLTALIDAIRKSYKALKSDLIGNRRKLSLLVIIWRSWASYSLEIFRLLGGGSQRRQ